MSVVNINDSEIKFNPFKNKKGDEEKPDDLEEKMEQIRKTGILEEFIKKKAGLPSNYKSDNKENNEEMEENQEEEENNEIDEEPPQPQKNIKNRKSKKFLKQEEMALLRTARICCIEGYFKSDRFGEYLKKKISTDTENIRELNDDKLDELYTEIRTQMDYRYKEKFVDNIVKGGLVIVEGAVDSLFPVPGFSLVLMNDPSFLDCLEELKLELPSARLPLPVRMGAIMVQTAIVCNKMAEQGVNMPIPQQSSKPVISKDNNKFVNRL